MTTVQQLSRADEVAPCLPVPRGALGDRLAVTRLARTFPTLRPADGVAPGSDFDPDAFEAWATSGAPSHGALLAASFVLAVFNGSQVSATRRRTKEGLYRHAVEHPWKVRPFDAVEALATWDDDHREAFLAWAQDPWWP